MAYLYDLFGWYAGEGEGARSTNSVPPTTSQTTTPGATRANWTGLEWIELPYITPVMPEDTPPAQPRHITKLAFRNRFTTQEKAALELAAVHNQNLAVDHASNLLAASLRASLADQRDATYIDLDRADTRAGVEGLEAAGLIGEGRAAEILDAAIEAAERYEE